MTHVDPSDEQTYQVLVIPSEPGAASTARETILSEVKRQQFPEEDTFAIKLALEEALANAIKHGNQNDPARKVTVRYAVTPQQVIIIVRDEGPGFAPDNIPDCTAPERLPLPDGRGIMLIRSYMDEVCYRDNGREVYLMKRRGSGSGS